MGSGDISFKKEINPQQSDLRDLLSQYKQLKQNLKDDLVPPDGLLARITRLENLGVVSLQRGGLKADEDLLRFLTSFNQKFNLPGDAVEFVNNGNQLQIKSFDKLRAVITKHEDSRREIQHRLGMIEDVIDERRALSK